jgi:hydroxymethylbilane synthase
VALLRIGSRGSQLALWQANHVRALLEQRGHKVELEIIKTTGDKITNVALSQVGTKGMFTKEIEEALADQRIDLAVHSLKDLPTEIPSGFEIAAIPVREDARDVFCSHQYGSIKDLPNGARVGTSSLRRQAQLKALRPDPGCRRPESPGQTPMDPAGAGGKTDVSCRGPGCLGGGDPKG